MTGYDRNDEDYQPLFWFRGYSIYATYLLVIVHVAAVVLSCLPLGVGQQWVLSASQFDSFLVLRGWVWQIFTYPFAYALASPQDVLFFFIDMYLLFRFGWDIERFMGRRVFLSLYVALVVVPALALLVLSVLLRAPLLLGGAGHLQFGVFIAYVVIYPNVEIFFSIRAKWVAWVLLAAGTLIGFVNLRSNPAMLPALWISVGTAYFGMRYAGAGGGLSLWGNLRQTFPRKKSPQGVKPRLKPKRLVETGVPSGGKVSVGSAPEAVSYDVHESIDPLLDKISKHGLASLTSSERAALERARVSLLRKERGE